MSFEQRFKNVLANLGMEVYTQPVNTDDTFVGLARIKSTSEQDFKIKEARVIFFIERLLRKSEANPEYRVRLARPWVLKDKNIAYTWDFTVKGSLDLAISDIESIKVPDIQRTVEEAVSTQQVKTTRGKVKPVTVGAR
tara:strand:- start:117 stop:530 length:414 start_codon:yes stop_codon:yes gene_type:complete